ncbi:hypothetical protein KIPB_010552, partial [Kipferlia bialata]
PPAVRSRPFQCTTIERFSIDIGTR